MQKRKKAVAKKELAVMVILPGTLPRKRLASIVRALQKLATKQGVNMKVDLRVPKEKAKSQHYALEAITPVVVGSPLVGSGLRIVRVYYVASGAKWFVVKARTLRHARSAGVQEFGRGMTTDCRRASGEEIRDYLRQRTKIEEI
jgi:hypothetical protein